MDKIALQIETVCLVSIFTGLIGSVIPFGRLKNAFTGFCAVVLIFSIASPLSEIGKKTEDLFSYSSEKNDGALLSDVKTAENMIFEKIVAEAIEKKLEGDGIKASVKVRSEHINEEYVISTFLIVAVLTDEEKTKISNYLNTAFSGCRISFEEADDG